MVCPLLFKDLVVDFDESYLSLGKKKQDRQAAFAQYVCDTVPEGEIKLIKDALQRGQLTGSERFRGEVYPGDWVSVFQIKALAVPKKLTNGSDPFFSFF